MQSPTFEKQIREIYEAITGEVIISENPLNADSVLDISIDLQNTVQSTRVKEGIDKRENKVESWAGLNVDLA